MRGGEIIVDGDVGIKTGRLMSGGRLVIHGNAGPWAASGMTAGYLEITGTAGDRLGGPLPGEIAGMRGGVVVVRGAVGDPRVTGCGAAASLWKAAREVTPAAGCSPEH